MFSNEKRSHLTIVVLLVTASALWTTMARAAENDPATAAPVELDPATVDFVIGNSLFVLLHEFGHMVIRDYDIPLLGLEENSADTLAAVALILLDHRDPDRDPQYSEFLAMASLGNLLTWRTGIEKSNQDILYWAQHSVSVRRATRTVCLLYGSDPDGFSWLAESAKMPEIRADWCEDEFALAERAVDWVLEAYGAPTDRTGVSESGRITIEYREPRTETQRQALEFLQQRRIIAGSAEFIEQSFDLIDDIEIIVRSCGVPNGFWDPDYREMIFCYELLEAFAQLGNSPEVQGLSDLFAAARE